MRKVMASISTIWTIFQVLFGILKEVKDLVDIFEEADSDDGTQHGPEKKNAIVELVGAVYDAAEESVDLPFKKETLLNLVDKAIDVIVGVMNAVGQFRSKSK